MIGPKTNSSKQFQKELDQRLEAFKDFKAWSILGNYVIAFLGGDGWQTTWSLGWRPQGNWHRNFLSQVPFAVLLKPCSVKCRKHHIFYIFCWFGLGTRNFGQSPPRLGPRCTENHWKTRLESVMPLPEVKLLHLRRCRKTSSRFLQRRTKRLGVGGQKCWLKGEYVGICWDELWFVEVFCSCVRVLAYRVYIPAKLSIVIVKIERYLKEKSVTTSLNAWMTL